jgi:hypothetical protein
MNKVTALHVIQIKPHIKWSHSKTHLLLKKKKVLKYIFKKFHPQIIHVLWSNVKQAIALRKHIIVILKEILRSNEVNLRKEKYMAQLESQLRIAAFCRPPVSPPLQNHFHRCCAWIINHCPNFPSSRLASFLVISMSQKPQDSLPLVLYWSKSTYLRWTHSSRSHKSPLATWTALPSQTPHMLPDPYISSFKCFLPLTWHCAVLASSQPALLMTSFLLVY